MTGRPRRVCRSPEHPCCPARLSTSTAFVSKFKPGRAACYSMYAFASVCHASTDSGCLNRFRALAPGQSPEGFARTLILVCRKFGGPMMCVCPFHHTGSWRGSCRQLWPFLEENFLSPRLSIRQLTRLLVGSHLLGMGPGVW